MDFPSQAPVSNCAWFSLQLIRTRFMVRDLCKTSPFAQSLRQAQILHAVKRQRYPQNALSIPAVARSEA